MRHCATLCFHSTDGSSFQNQTVEERLTILEAEMIVALGGIEDLNTEVDFLIGEQFLQDTRILALEQDTGDLEDSVQGEASGVGLNT